MKGGVSMGLSIEIRKLINDIAEGVREIYGIATPIIDIDQIVRKMGGDVIEDPTIDNLSDGRIRKIDEESFIIEVSPFQSEERRNFTIAHEIGHLFLHMGYGTERWGEQDSISYYRSGNSKLEYQSNEFAAVFLMPQQDYKREMDKHTEGNLVNTYEIAKYFHVSVDAAANRGKQLGYLRW